MAPNYDTMYPHGGGGGASVVNLDELRKRRRPVQAVSAGTGAPGVIVPTQAPATRQPTSPQTVTAAQPTASAQRTPTAAPLSPSM
jgi:hypothetical protein